MAAEILRARGLRYDFRVAGTVSPTVRNKRECRALTFLGQVARNKIADEFAKADLFVLPSLAEGSATVTYEALALGIPVITTRAAGSPVRDGVDGAIVPERAPEALADAIERIAEDRKLRESMSRSARCYGNRYNWHRYASEIRSLLTAAGVFHAGQMQ